MGLRLNRTLAASVVLVVLSVAGATLAQPASAQVGSGAWHARIVVPGQFEGAVSAGGNLYAVRQPGSFDLAYVVRVNPASGHIVAHSQTLPDAQLPVFSGGELWVSGLTPKRSRGIQRPVLTELNPATLRRIRQVPYPGIRAQTPTLIAGPGHVLVAVDVARQSGCVLRWIDPASGRITRNVIVGASVGQCGGATIDSSGQSVYVIADGPTVHVTLFRADEFTGAVEREIRLPAVSQFFSITATPDRIWIGGGDPGTNGSLLYLAVNPMRLLAQSDPVNGARQTLPTFGQFPQVGLSGGRIWVASDGPLGCFAPSSSRALAIVKQGRSPIVSDTIVDAAGRVWSVGGGTGNPPYGLTRLFPPRSCR